MRRVRADLHDELQVGNSSSHCERLVPKEPQSASWFDGFRSAVNLAAGISELRACPRSPVYGALRGLAARPADDDTPAAGAGREKMR